MFSRITSRLSRSEPVMMAVASAVQLAVTLRTALAGSDSAEHDPFQD